MSTPVRVVVRVRPILSSKGELSKGVNEYVQVDTSKQTLTNGFGPRSKTNTYSSTFGASTSQADFFAAVGEPALNDLWEGMNSTILAYGPAGSGKRFTTFGGATTTEQGLIPRIAQQLFERLVASTAAGDGSYKVEFSFFESYCENCNDLLKPSGRNLNVSYINNVGYHVNTLTRCPITTYAQLNQLLEGALTARAVSAISTNTDTTQSHTFFQLVLTRTSVDKKTMKAIETTSTLLIADLGDAGGGQAERAAMSAGMNDSPGDSHAAFRQAVTYLLHNKMHSNNKNKDDEVDDNTNVEKNNIFQQSQLTKILRNSMNGNCKTTLLVVLPPTDIDQDVTQATIQFTNQFKKLKTKIISNIDGSKKQIENLKNEINALKKNLAGTSSSSEKMKYERIQSDIGIANNLLEILMADWNTRATTTIKEITQALAVSQLDAVEAAKLTTPYLSNISNDPMMHGRVIHFLNPNIKTQVGNAEGSDMTSLIYGTHNCGLGNDTQGGSAKMNLMGLSIDVTHCAITNDSNEIKVINMSQHTCISGDTLHPSDQHVLKDGDWIVFGKTFDKHVYEVVHPLQKEKDEKDERPKWNTVIETMCSTQLHGLHRQQKLAGMRSADALHLQQRVLQIIPCIDEANLLAKELARPKKFDINIIASSDGHRKAGRRLSVGASSNALMGANAHTGLSLEVIVQEVSNVAETKDGSNKGAHSKPSIWTEYKFLERSFGMRNMHLSYLTEMNGHIGELNKKYPSSKDPFYDPLQDVLIGTAVAYLNPISYIISIDQPLTILDTRGSAEGELIVNIKPVVYRDDLMENAIDTDEENEPRLEHYVGSGTLRIHLSIQGARHLDPSKIEGVYVSFMFLNEEIEVSTKPSLDADNVNPTLNFTKTYEYDITTELIQQISEDVIEFHVLCKGNEKNANVKSAPRLGFLSEVGDGTSAAHTFNSPSGKSKGGAQKSSPGVSARKTNDGGGDMGDRLGGNYGGAVDAHKSELEKAAMRQRILELEDQLANANSKSKACVIL